MSGDTVPMSEDPPGFSELDRELSALGSSLKSINGFSISGLVTGVVALLGLLAG